MKYKKNMNYRNELRSYMKELCIIEKNCVKWKDITYYGKKLCNIGKNYVKDNEELINLVCSEYQPS